MKAARCRRRLSAAGAGVACPGTSPHTFTHFPLQLVVYSAQVPAGTRAPAGARWVALAGLAEEALPSVMRKVVAHAAIEETSGRRSDVSRLTRSEARTHDR